MSSLKVYFENELVGILTKHRDLTYSFDYEESWQKNSKSFALSLAMPLTQRKYGNRTTLSFFENLLPEGEVRDHFERVYKVREPFDFLKKFGRDCAGAVIVTDREDYKFSGNTDDSTELDLFRLNQAIADHESVADVVSETNPGYLSLAGAQDKFPAIYRNGTFYIPNNGAPTTHIVKTPIWRSGVRDSVYNEYYCMRLAKAVGLPVPNCEIVELEHPLFVIERYDRYNEGSETHRIHQQDFCQAQGLTSESKYEDRGGPSLKDNFDLIQAKVAVRKRTESLRLYMDWVCFNLLIGNNDSHSKNISFLLVNGRIELTPFYDLMSTALYPKLKKAFSFKIGGRDAFHQIGKNQFEDLERDVRLKKGAWLKRLVIMDNKLREAKEQLAHEMSLEYKKVKIFGQINDLISERSKGLKNQQAL